MNSPLLHARHLLFGPPTCCHRTGGTPTVKVAVRHTLEAEGLLSSDRLQVN